MNNDLISRQAAIDAANDWLLDCLHVQKQDRSCGLIRRLEDLPSAQPERKKGKWIQRSDTPWYYYCSNCHRVISVMSVDQMEKFHAFCGTCGADMREEKSNEISN